MGASQREKRSDAVDAHGCSSRGSELVSPAMFHMTDDARVLVVAEAVGANAKLAGSVRLAVTAFLQRLPRQLPRPVEAHDKVATAFEHANAAVLAEDQRKGLASMADAVALCTLVFCESCVVVANIGNCRCYCVGGGRLRLLSREHSAVAELRTSAGQPTPAMDAFALHHRNILTRALGLSEHVSPDLSIEELHDGSRYLLCSAGVWERISETDLQALLAGPSSLEDVCQALTSKLSEHESEQEQAYPYAFIVAEHRGRPRFMA